MASSSLPNTSAYVAQGSPPAQLQSPSPAPLGAPAGYYNYDSDAGSARRRAAPPRTAPLAAKIGPQRTSKVSQKLKILPSPADQDEESGRDVYSQGAWLLPPRARARAR